ncbi:CLUMA_CG002572, isoform A [Clunio marinus]|uniref:CLUMA_CG002572, isoform A n=1 Tax=Clunio marinus TaxID=568069 RepID=A0A1J1HM00_9DIPT|nr:CLUMA_CG002572, isoform A [Clunio marinus]
MVLSDLCLKQFTFFKNALNKNEEWATKFKDTSANIQYSGMLHGITRNLGLFSECENFVHETNSSGIGTFHGQHCLISYEADIDYVKRYKNLLLLYEYPSPMNKSKLQYGFCFPKSCSPEDINELAKYEILTQKQLNFVGTFCQTTQQRTEFKIFDYFAVLFFVTLFGLIISSTLYDVMKKRNKLAVNSNKLFTLFSVCLRVLAAFWIVAGHCIHLLTRIHFTENFNKFERETAVLIGFHLLAVETFLVIGGFLAAQSFMKAFKRQNFSYFKCMFKRYLRYGPAFHVLLLFFASSIANLTFNGPMIGELLRRQDICRDTWWAQLLMINDFVGMKCLSHAWYLAVDFKFYLITPLLVSLLMKYGKKTVGFLVAVVLIDYSVIFYCYLKDVIPYDRLYHESTFRIGSWLIGVILGYVMQEHNPKISKGKTLIGWIISYASIIGIMFGWSRYESREAYAFNQAMNSFIWSLHTAWIIYACHYLKSGGIIRRFLEHHMWQPLAKLCLSIYLTHYLFI